MINNILLPELDGTNLDIVNFHQDCATRHTINKTIDFFTGKVAEPGYRLISQRGYRN